MTDELPWAEVTDSSWTPVFERVISGLVVQFFGACPRCTHSTSEDFPRVVLGGPTVRAEEEPFTMYCKCGYPHAGHPDEDNGCGAYWPYAGEL